MDLYIIRHSGRSSLPRRSSRPDRKYTHVLSMVRREGRFFFNCVLIFNFLFQQKIDELLDSHLRSIKQIVDERA